MYFDYVFLAERVRCGSCTAQTLLCACVLWLSRHPELLLAPLEEIRRKLQILKNTTGAIGEDVLEMLSPYMFTGLD